MIMTIENKRRELFEATTKLPEGVVWCSDQAKYVGMNYWLADYGFAAFNAALDSLCIELPSHIEYTGSGEAIEACRSAIEQTGLGLKVRS